MNYVREIKMNLEIINVGNGTKEYPGNFTRKEIDIININTEGLVVNLFSGKSNIGYRRIDYAYGNVKMDVFDYLESCKPIDVKQTIILDAPYNQKFADKYQGLGNTPKQFIIFANTKDTTRLFNLIREKVDPEIIIMKSWNYYIPLGYKLKKGYLCYAGGYRKSTILLILERL
jgi:hypothetical protein